MYLKLLLSVDHRCWILQILNECFRPIISSFKARLASIFPPHAKEGTTSSASGSFETICAGYEATLQFLSVAYESMVDFNSSNSGDNDKSSSPSRTKTPVELYQMVRSTFITIGSPFAPYQASFAELEANQSGMTARVVSRDVHGAVALGKVGSAASLLQSMQDSVEKLTGLAPFVFPLARGKHLMFFLLVPIFNTSNLTAALVPSLHAFIFVTSCHGTV
jgi:hypothetical protein